MKTNSNIRLNVYQRPAVGFSHIDSFQVFGYRHKISAVGGCDTASCMLNIPLSRAQKLLEDYIGCRVAVYAANPIEPIWEGLISRVSYEYGDIVYTMSLDDTANRAIVIWTDAGVTTPTTTTVVNNTESQARFGVIAKVLDGLVTGNLNTPHKNAIRDKYLATHAYPQASAAFRSSGGIALRIEMLGFYHTLEWDQYISTTTTDASASTLVTEIVQGNANNTTFFDDTVTAFISSNTTFNLSRESRTGLSRWQFLQQVQEAGDGVNEWVMGITPTDPNTGKRYFYYQAANTQVEYVVCLRQGLAQIRLRQGGRVDPWSIRPNRSIQIVDVLPAWALPGDDPRIVYIDTVEYDAESRLITYQGRDDTTLDGVLRLKQIYKPIKNRSGATVRFFA